MFHGITTLSFDLDDTLWPVRPVILGAERAMREWLDQHYPQMYGQRSFDELRALRRSVIEREPHTAHDLTYIRKRVLTLMAEHAGYGNEPVEPAFAVFDEHRHRVAFYPDALPALAQLSRRYRLVALSNGNASPARTEAGRFFHAHVSARDVGAAKPHPDMFHAAARAADAEPAEVLHIGDDPHLDVQGARDAGQRALWINRESRSWPPELLPPTEISSLDALVRLLMSHD